MEAKTPKEFFEDILPKKFNKEKAAGIDVVAQIDLTGSNGGSWFVVIKNQQIETKEGTCPTPSLAIKATDTDFMNIINGKMSAERAFMTGKIQFKGNIALALKLKDAGFL